VRAGDFVTRERSYAQGKYAHVVNLFAHIYREQSVVRHQPLLTVPFETRLETGDQSNERWVEVQLPDGRTGWVQTGDVSLDDQRLAIPASIDLAKRFMGLPYTWGGTSSYGYDCSGFTQMLLRQRGVVMPRDADDQAAWDGVKAVGEDELEPGDLLFFGPSEEKITHTGMYIGDGQFIHATTHERPVIQISRLADEHWTKVFVAARRLK
jgi:cell wall-associated NlpC family hydrolase